MRTQAQIPLLILLGMGMVALLGAGHGEGNSEEAYRRGDYLQALKGFQAETTAELVSRGKAPAKQEWADSGTWEVESPNALKSLCLFEKGVQAWVKGDAPAAVKSWMESQKEALRDPLDKRTYFRRTQLAMLMAEWGKVENAPQKGEAVLKVAADIQTLPLPENTPDMRCQIRAEQVVEAAARYMRLTSRVGEAAFPQLLMET